MIQCQCDNFHFVSWYTRNQYESNETPLINFNMIDKKGAGYRSGKYDIGTNGSLIIKNVTLEQDCDYIVIFAQDELKRTNVSNVHVTVIVTPEPAFPVIEDQINHHYVYLDVDRIGSLTCSITRAHPVVKLIWTGENAKMIEKIHFKHNDTKTTQNTDGTYNISVTSFYEIDMSAKIVRVQCSIIGELSEFVRWNHSIAELNVRPDFPVIDNGSDPQRVYVDVSRTGQLRCTMRNVTDQTKLHWEVLEYSSKDVIISDIKTKRYRIKENSYNITLSSHYTVIDSIARITIECKVTGAEIEDYLKIRRVDLLFTKAPSIPVIDGCFSKQDHCVLETPRTGEIVCSVKNSPYEVDLVWNEQTLPYLDYRNETRNIQKRGKFYNISIITPYTVPDESVTNMAVTCLSVYKNEIISGANASLTFRKAPITPVIDGCFSKQDHCVLETPETGEIVCSVKDSPYEVDLKWDEQVLPYLDYQNEKRNIQKRGKFSDISIITPYSVPDESVTKMTVTCLSVYNKETISGAKASLTFRRGCDDANHWDLHTVLLVTLVILCMATFSGLAVYLIVSSQRRKQHSENKKDLENGGPNNSKHSRNKANNSNGYNQDNGRSHEGTELLDMRTGDTNEHNVEDHDHQ